MSWTVVYDALAATYDAGTAGTWQANRHVAEVLRPQALRPARVLDLGAGTGQTAAMLRALYPDAALTLVDPSAAMLALAPEKVPGARTFVADAESFLRDTDGSWDLVAAVGFLELVPDLDRVLGLAAARVAPGGHLVVSHEPLLDDGSVQSRPVSVVGGAQHVHRRPRTHVEDVARSCGLLRTASLEAPAFVRSGEGEGDAVYEYVLWHRPAAPAP
ncbi:class I SAM-dependent methyltransferase [Nocardioides okcheonensis]|uniref:class I SAM-dependent methyltransferase n=1 Tax=Nocardioides okcheonensis TaxID=2894081 RepID=UPI001E431DF8|nr:methyltransferase domain-containing protein [Nocardioides okcheonensis]UFN45340.1 methyltransferase domain-containing protein [Nocardioides okcheonensis]